MAMFPSPLSGYTRTFSMFLLLLILPLPAGAQDPPQPSPPPPDPPPPVFEFDEGRFTAFSVVLDNDVLPHIGSENEDRNYTGGLGFRLSGGVIRKLGLTKPLEGLDWLTRMNRVHAPGERTYHSFLLFGTAFTPDAIQFVEPQRDDRPYGSILGVSVRRMTVDDATLDRAWSSELVVAGLGLDVAENVQTALHRRLRKIKNQDTPYDPLGWHNQISPGGEITGLYRVGFEKRLLGDESGGARKHWQVVGGVEGSAGYYTNAAASLSSRVGFFTSDFWESSSGGMNLGVGQQKSGSDTVPRWDLFAFGVLRPRLVLYNGLLQGQFRDSVHTVDPKHLLGEWEGGVALSVPFFKTSYQIAGVVQFAQGRSSEFEGPNSRSHAWGSWLLVFSRPGVRR